MNTPNPVECIRDGYGLIRAVHHQERDAAAEAIDGMTLNELRGVLAAIVSYAVTITEILTDHDGKTVDGLLDVLNDAL